MFSAVNGFEFFITLDGCVTRGSGGVAVFVGKMNLKVRDGYNFSNPETGDRTPFATVPFLNDHFPSIAGLQEEEFRQLELHKYTRPFDVKGEKVRDVRVSVGANSSTASVRPAVGNVTAPGWYY
jgi:hypothetical protein